MSCDSVRPQSLDNTEPKPIPAVRDQKVEASMDNGIGIDSDINITEQVEAHEGQEEFPEIEEEFLCRVCDPVDEDIDEEAEEEAETQRPFRDPGMPSRREFLEHCLTHIPPRPWCPHCVRCLLYTSDAADE